MTRGLIVAATAALLAPGAASQPPLLGSVWDTGGLRLVRVEPDTLRRLPGRGVPMAAEPLAWSFSPDRSRLALGSTSRRAVLRFVGLTAMRPLGGVTIRRRGSIMGTTWAGADRVLAAIALPGCCGAGDTLVAAVDTARRRVLWRRVLGGSLQAGERHRGGFALLLGPRKRAAGASRLVLVDEHGGVRSAALPAIRSGIEQDGARTREWNPGLAVDRRGGRAFAVQAGAPVTEVDLETLAIREYSVGLSSTSGGARRHALWLRGGRLAVTGVDAGRRRERPAGLTLVDVRHDSARVLDPRVTDTALVAGTLLASTYVTGPRGRALPGSGLTGYSRDGERRFHLYGRRPLTGVQPLGANALVGAPRAITLLRARTGRELRRFRTLEMGLLSGDAPFPY